jgi:hypothetical protein
MELVQLKFIFFRTPDFFHLLRNTTYPFKVLPKIRQGPK